ncbi:hypothetical protein SBD_1382 [Streptomyces bottropensis ATCC 25435]|uniref:Uncharacterized protein n=1 Tax=Streptomyces bottropensis ATCC 25435 TaxID=1054862 RepID=M3FYB2_9ACTN|nr:hypothetical protein SBD_1382 [Streptomyces bottropensis ATCC 25435]
MHGIWPIVRGVAAPVAAFSVRIAQAYQQPCDEGARERTYSRGVLRRR